MDPERQGRGDGGRGVGSLEARWLEHVRVRLPRAIQTGKLVETSRPQKGSGGSEQRQGRIRLLFKTTPVAVLRTGLELMLRDWGDLQDIRMQGGGRGGGQCWVQGSSGGGDDVQSHHLHVLQRRMKEHESHGGTAKGHHALGREWGVSQCLITAWRRGVCLESA